MKLITNLMACLGICLAAQRCAAQAEADTSEFHEPRLVMLDGESSFACTQAPSLAVTDADHDGLPELIVGNGTYSIYTLPTIVGSSEPLAVDKTGVVRSGKGTLEFADGGQLSLVDINGDGFTDWLFGTTLGRGAVMLALGSEQGLVRPSAIQDETGRLIGYAGDIDAFDMDGDDDIDLFLEATTSFPDGMFRNSTIWVIENIGTNGKPVFSRKNQVTLAGKLLSIGASRPDILTVDWDNDGFRDLLVGTNEGELQLYLGTSNPLDFRQSSSPLPARRRDSVLTKSDVITRKQRWSFCIVDWNQDGKLDVLMASNGIIAPSELTESDQRAIVDLESQIRELVQRYRALRTGIDNETVAVSQQRNKTLQKLQSEITTLRKEVDLLKPQRINYGRISSQIWYFERK